MAREPIPTYCVACGRTFRVRADQRQNAFVLSCPACPHWEPIVLTFAAFFEHTITDQDALLALGERTVDLDRADGIGLEVPEPLARQRWHDARFALQALREGKFQGSPTQHLTYALMLQTEDAVEQAGTAIAPPAADGRQFDDWFTFLRQTIGRLFAVPADLLPVVPSPKIGSPEIQDDLAALLDRSARHPQPRAAMLPASVALRPPHYFRPGEEPEQRPNLSIQTDPVLPSGVIRVVHPDGRQDFHILLADRLATEEAQRHIEEALHGAFRCHPDTFYRRLDDDS